ncbi:hypothetical protein EHS25_005484 [Saitozyma podzolica]|uniref:Major facilitator superfamily (MFS) profile domain-containing protein n=1 Tax=Saitozyma podzolica TaxID=1890683 RepID=A0A427XYE0_9TREE|nr:hypothetical protein EHS25_005484 [Saitozyma podzolica]
MAPGLSSASGGTQYHHLQNNCAKWWFQDAGMRRLALAIAVGFAGTINSGYDGSLMNGLLSNPIFITAIDNPDANKLGIISAAYALGGVPGLFPASFVADRFGRRMAICIGALLIITGGLVQTFTTGGNAMLAGRFVVGLGSSFQGVGGGPYTAEISHPRNRAQTTALINTCWYIGSILAAWTCYGALNISGAWSWRICTLIQIVPCCIQLCVLWFVEESPRWLVSKGHEEQAFRILAKYHSNGDPNDELVKFEFEEIKEAIEAERSATAGVSWSSFFKTKGNRHRTLIIVLVAFFSQWVGNGIISYYLASILASVGVTSPSQQAGFNGGLQIWNWFAAIAGSLACERLGRRFLWLTSACGMLLSFSIITACSAVYSHTQAQGAGRAVMAFLFIYFGFYDIAFTGLTLGYPLEILPFSLRAKGMALFNFFVSCALFFNQYVNPIALDALAWKYYFVYIGTLCIAIVCIYFLYPETRGRMLEEVAEIFDGPQAALPVVQEQQALEHNEGKNGADHKEQAVTIEYA